jgi:hypothetical protein
MCQILSAEADAGEFPKGVAQVPGERGHEILERADVPSAIALVQERAFLERIP